MVNSLGSDEMVDGSVFIVLFNTAPTGGWLLYFKGLKQETVISKFYRVHSDADELAIEAVHYLAAMAGGAGWSLNVRVMGAEIANEKIAPVFDSYSHLSRSDTEHLGTAVDEEILDYLFSSAKNKKLALGMSASDVQKMKRLPMYESVEMGKAVITSDASYVPAGRRERSAAMGGTGWVIGYHDEEGAPEIALGSQSYTPVEPYNSSNALELHAVKDALTAALEIDGLIRSTSTILLYSDSDFAITAIRNEEVNDHLTPLLNSVLESVSAFTRLGIRVEFRWTKGHSGNHWNDLAHAMAAVGRKGESHDGDHLESALSLLQRNALI